MQTTNHKIILSKTNSRNVLDLAGYSETVIVHWLNPRNFRSMKNFHGYSRKITSPCGDSMWIWLKAGGNTISEATFVSDICIGAVPSGSMLTETVTGMKITQALRLRPDDILRALGGLPEEFIHCTDLATTTLKAAILDLMSYRRAPRKRLYEK